VASSSALAGHDTGGAPVVDVVLVVGVVVVDDVLDVVEEVVVVDEVLDVVEDVVVDDVVVEGPPVVVVLLLDVVVEELVVLLVDVVELVAFDVDVVEVAVVVVLASVVEDDVVVVVARVVVVSRVVVVVDEVVVVVGRVVVGLAFPGGSPRAVMRPARIRCPTMLPSSWTRSAKTRAASGAQSRPVNAPPRDTRTLAPPTSSDSVLASPAAAATVAPGPRTRSPSTTTRAGPCASRCECRPRRTPQNTYSPPMSTSVASGGPGTRTSPYTPGGSDVAP